MKISLLQTIRPQSGFRIAPNLTINWKNDNDDTICRHEVIVKFFDIAMFLLLSLVIGPSFISLSLLVLELWQISFIKD